MKAPFAAEAGRSLDGRWLAWLACLILSTAALVGPSLALTLRAGIDAGVDPQLDQTFYLASKAFHVADYALLAALTGWLRAPRRLRLALLAFLSLHAVGTEFVQCYVETRTGSLRDVGFDHLGVALGLALTWKAWRVRAAVSPVSRAPGAAA